MQFFTGEEHPTFNLKAELKKLMYTSGKPLVISEDSATFTMAMAFFYQHEKHVSTFTMLIINSLQGPRKTCLAKFP